MTAYGLTSCSTVAQVPQRIEGSPKSDEGRLRESFKG